MTRTVTTSIDDVLYHKLSERVDMENVDDMLEEALRSILGGSTDLDEDYRLMAADEAREREAREWAEGLVEDNTP